MKSPVAVCPVPTEQQPLEEYNALRESWFFRWGTLGLWAYLKPIGILWALGWLLAAPVAAVSFPFVKQPIFFLLSTSAGATIIPVLALIRLYLGWFYIRNRLSDDRIVYEESGWYDGQIWEKPDEVLQRDRLIATYQVQPILRRLHYTFAVALLVLGSGSLAWIIRAGLR